MTTADRRQPPPPSQADAAGAAGARPLLPLGATIVAALQIQGEHARIAIGDLSSGTLALKQTQTLPAANLGPIADLFEQLGIQLVLRVAPAAEVLCRTAPLPGTGTPSSNATETRETPRPSDRSELASALELLAEAELPANLPWWRRCSGVIALGPGGSQHAALLVGWPEAKTTDRRSRSLRAPWPCPEVWIPEPACLAIVAAAADATFAASVDRAAGSLALVAAGPTKSLVRVLRLPSDADSWAASVAKAGAETAAAVDLAAPPLRLPVQDPALVLPGAPSPRLASQPRDAAFTSTFGLAVAALHAWSSGDPAVQSFAALFAVEPVARASILERTLRWLSHPWRAAAAIVLALAILLGLPLAVAETRLDLLQKKIGDVDAMRTRLAAAEQRAAFYQLLRDRRWPMTKLLADIAGAAPLGIRLEAVELAPPDTVLLRGTAETTSLVTTFRENLASTQLFNSVTTPTTGSTAEGVQFQLQARIAPRTAIFPVTPKDDFAARTLAQRMYGDEAVAAATRPERARRTRDRDGTRTPPSDRPSTPDRSARTPAPTQAPTPSGPAAAKPIPTPITDADIAKLTSTQAMLEGAKRKSAARLPTTDETTRQRLMEEAAKLDDRMKQARTDAPAPSPTPARGPRS